MLARYRYRNRNTIDSSYRLKRVVWFVIETSLKSTIWHRPAASATGLVPGFTEFLLPAWAGRRGGVSARAPTAPHLIEFLQTATKICFSLFLEAISPPRKTANDPKVVTLDMVKLATTRYAPERRDRGPMVSEVGQGSNLRALIGLPK